MKNKATFAGHKHTKETKQKMRLAHLGKKHSLETRLKMSKNHRRYQSEETKKKIGEANKGNPGYWEGKKRTTETKKKIGEASKGRPSYWKGKNMPEEHVEKYRQKKIKWWSKLDINLRRQHLKSAHAAAVATKVSSIEFAIQKVLDSLDITYIPQYSIGWYHVDIFIPSKNLIIECDGDYWHNLPGAQEKDAKRDAYLKRKGYNVVRIWEHEIRKDAKEAFLKAIR